MTDLSLKNQFEIKDLELNALLEVTQAINNNVPEESLYKIYNFILRSNLNIKKLALYVLDDDWSCKVNYGTQTDLSKTKLPDRFRTLSDIRALNSEDHTGFGEFSLLIPVAHKTENLAIVFVGGLDKYDKGYENSDGIRFIRALSNIIIVAIENKKLARHQLEQEALRKEIEIASDVQQFLFPETLPNTNRLTLEASYFPHDRVGGDYYDYIPINKNQFLFCVADVSGKGIPAALMMSNFQASLRTLVRQTPNLREIVEALNYQVMENTKGEKFITFFGGIYDIALKTLIYINAGHNPPLLCCPGKPIRLLEEGSTVLGAMNPLPFLHEGFIPELDDFLIFCYTDGLTETRSEDGNEFGQAPLLNYFEQNTVFNRDLKIIHQDIIVQLDTFKGRNGYHDDITLLSCRVTR